MKVSKILINISLLLTMIFHSKLQAGIVVGVDDEHSTFVAADETYEIGQNLCVYHNSKRIGCGTVIEEVSDGYLVQLEDGMETVSDGDEVRSSDKSSASSDENSATEQEYNEPFPDNNADPSTEPSIDDSDESYETDTHSNRLTSGNRSRHKVSEDPSQMSRIQLLAYHRSLIRGDSYFAKDNYENSSSSFVTGKDYLVSIGPTFHDSAGNGSLGVTASFQNKLSSNTTMGVGLSFFSFGTENATTKATGGYVNVTYSLDTAYIGPFAKLAAGILVNSYPTQTSLYATGPSTDLSAYFIVGYQWYLQSHFNLGLGAGIQYLYLLGQGSTATVISVDSQGSHSVLPMASIEVGYIF